MKNWVIGFMLMGFIFGCNDTTEKKAVEKNEITTISKVDTSDWIGVYLGTVPHAKDTNDISLDMKLTLNPSNTYSLIVTHLRKNPKDNYKKDYSGQIEWDEDSTTITLHEIDSLSKKFKIKPGKVEYLNPDATPNSGNLSEFYVLKKQKTSSK